MVKISGKKGCYYYYYKMLINSNYIEWQRKKKLLTLKWKGFVHFKDSFTNPESNSLITTTGVPCLPTYFSNTHLPHKESMASKQNDEEEKQHSGFKVCGISVCNSCSSRTKDNALIKSYVPFRQITYKLIVFWVLGLQKKKEKKKKKLNTL